MESRAPFLRSLTTKKKPSRKDLCRRGTPAPDMMRDCGVENTEFGLACNVEQTLFFRQNVLSFSATMLARTVKS